MGSPEAAPLLSLAESIADGESIDWSVAEARAGGADEAIVRQLRVISELAELHRSVSTVTMPPPDAARRRSAAGATSRCSNGWAAGPRVMSTGPGIATSSAMSP